MNLVEKKDKLTTEAKELLKQRDELITKIKELETSIERYNGALITLTELINEEEASTKTAEPEQKMKIQK